MPTHTPRHPNRLVRAGLRLGLPCLAGLLNPAALAQEQPPARGDVEEPPILIADFEADDYGDWQAQGETFGQAPARGTLDNQMPVSGYRGKGLVNTYRGGDGTVGRLLSPEFEIRRDYIHFLIGGGRQPDQLSMRLLIDGKPARSATGNQGRPGGEERLEPQGWDVSGLRGKTARIEIIDHATGGWGHLTIDHITQSNDPAREVPAFIERQLSKGVSTIHLPVSMDAPIRRMWILVDGQEQREFDIPFAEGQPQFWTTYDISAFRDQPATLRIDSLDDPESLSAIRTGGQLPTDVALYEETYRPQFHFTALRGWLNDPNGLVYQDGVWHLYYQHNPFGTRWDNMTWGHATSTDLLHWKHLPIGLHPRDAEDMAYSGSAVIDHGNTSGFGTADHPALVAAYTSTGRGECVVYSTDGGTTFTEYEGNPVVRHTGRDPRLQWYAPGGFWSMVIYNESEGRQWFTFYTSPDLKEWTYQSRRADWFECPDLVEIVVDGDADHTRWMLFGADGVYQLGRFDGKAYTPDEDERYRLWFGDVYAGQRYTNTPDGRTIYIGWARHLLTGDDHAQRGGMPFNQQMTIPMELRLVTTEQGPRVCALPVREIEALRERTEPLKPANIGNQADTLAAGELLDIELTIEPNDVETVELNARGYAIRYNAAERTLSCGHVTAPVQLIDGGLKLRVLIDRASAEVFVNDGRQVLVDASLCDPEQKQVTLQSTGGTARLVAGRVHHLRSVWD